MLDVTSDPDYAKAYEHLPEEHAGDVDLAEERRFFMSNVDGLSMQMTLFQQCVQQHKNLFVVDPDFLISSVVHLTEDRVDNTGYERLNARLQLHEIMLKQTLPNKEEVRHQLYLLKLISFLVPFLIGMKKRMRIPDLGKMLPNLTGKSQLMWHWNYPITMLHVHKTYYSTMAIRSPDFGRRSVYFIINHRVA